MPSTNLIVHRLAPSPGCWRGAELAAKGAAECRVGLIADVFGNACQRGVGATQEIGGKQHAPLRQVLHRRAANELMEAFGEHRSRSGSSGCQFFQSPGMRRPM